MRAARYGHTLIVEALIGAIADLNIREKVSVYIQAMIDLICWRWCGQKGF